MIVVDASVAIKWVVPETFTELSDTLVKRNDLIAPQWLLVESANALRKKISAGMLTPEQAHNGLEFITQRIVLLPTPLAIVSRALAIATRLGHGVYDCVYLAHCEAEYASLATYDQELARRAHIAGLGHLLLSLPLKDGT